MRTLLIAAGTAVALSGCVTATPPAPPVLEFARSDCGALDLSRAVSLTPPKERALFLVNQPVEADAPCMSLEGGRTAYALFALPDDMDDKTLTVGGLLEATRILSPSVAVLDGEGKVVRRFRPDEFMYRGANYSVLFRPRAPERYVLVSVDPARVGQKYDSIVIGTNTTSTYTPYGPVMITTGSTGSLSRVFSYEGSVQVTVHDSDTKEDGSAAR